MKTLSDLLALKDKQSTDLQESFNRVFDQDKALQESIKLCTNMEQGFYSLDESGFLNYCVSLDTDNEYLDCEEELLNYIYEAGMHIDHARAEHISNCCGDAFYTIQSEGQLGSETVCYQSGKEIARLQDDDSDAFYQAIEDHMEEQGCFPEVMRIDDHGGIDLDGGYYEWLKEKNKKETK